MSGLVQEPRAFLFYLDFCCSCGTVSWLWNQEDEDEEAVEEEKDGEKVQEEEEKGQEGRPPCQLIDDCLFRRMLFLCSIISNVIISAKHPQEEAEPGLPSADLPS